MTSPLAAVGSLIWAYVGFVLLALAMDRHYRAMLSTTNTGAHLPVTGLRLTGAMALLVSLWTAMRAWGATEGIVAWFGVLTLGASFLTLLLAYRPPMAPKLGLIAIAFGVSTSLIETCG
ncbi:MAG: DUF3325 domain-containing protein [Phycisphaerae bacterium]